MAAPQVEKLYEESLLYDFYGELLTEHQKQVFEDAVLNDYSLAEVAEDIGISRQGVHDLVKRTRQALAGYEEKLHLVQKFIRIRDNVNRIQKMTEDEGIRKLTEEILEEL